MSGGALLIFQKRKTKETHLQTQQSSIFQEWILCILRSAPGSRLQLFPVGPAPWVVPHWGQPCSKEGKVSLLNHFTLDSAKSKIDKCLKLQTGEDQKTTNTKTAMNGNILGFCPYNQKLRKVCINQGFTPGVKGLNDSFFVPGIDCYSFSKIVAISAGSATILKL